MNKIMFWNEILWFLTWPVLIFVIYKLIMFLIKKYETILEKINE